MALTVKNNSELGERLFVNTLSSGIKCYIIPKSGYKGTMAAIGVGFGAVDIEFSDETGVTTVPLGTAHFLEHKLFENKDGNAMEHFEKLGASANAFTDANKTAYYFTSKENFIKSIEILLDFVQEPYFEEKSVEHEKSIIAQEIRMYEDDPYWKVYFNMLQVLYPKHSVHENITGTIESINKISPEILYRCYNKFYRPQNMTIVCCGDIDPVDVSKICDAMIKKTTDTGIKEIIENTDIGSGNTETQMGLSKPVFCIGFALSLPQNGCYLKKTYAVRMLFDIMFGEGSEFFDEMYIMGALNQEPSIQYMSGNGYAFVALSGKSNDASTVIQKIKETIGNMRKTGISIQNFKRIHKKHIGWFVRGFNSVDAIVTSQLELGLEGFDIFEAFDTVKDMNKLDIENVLKNESFDKVASSVIK